MPTITLKNIPEELYERIKQSSKVNRRSINSEIIRALERQFLSGTIDVNSFQQEVQQIRDLSAHYVIGDDEIDAAKKEGRR